ncbi:MAG TPA: hypothetical protein PKH60_03765 [Candidatus Woesebacteria bacterium]|nr:hypothetical protein [Candidatus Woesebacteria bacterium]
MPKFKEDIPDKPVEFVKHEASWLKWMVIIAVVGGCVYSMATVGLMGTISDIFTLTGDVLDKASGGSSNNSQTWEPSPNDSGAELAPSPGFDLPDFLKPKNQRPPINCSALQKMNGGFNCIN